MLLATVGLVGCQDPALDDPMGLDALEIKVSVEDAARLGREGKYTEATEALRPHASVPSPPTNVLALYGSALMQNQRPSLGVWALARAAERPDAGPQIRPAYLRALISGGDSLAAVDAATRYLEASPDDEQILDLRSQAYASSFQYENALADLEILADENPDVPILVERTLNLLIQIEEWDGARERIAELREMLAKDGVSQEARTSFCATAAQFEQQRGDFELAETELRKCLEQHPGDLTLVGAMTELLDATDRVDEATRMMADLVEEHPKRQGLVTGYAERLVALGRRDEAEQLLLDAVEAAPHVNLWLALANLRLEGEDLEGTVVAMDRAVEAAIGVPVSDPALDWGRLLPESRFGIGDVYVRAGRFERAAPLIASLREDEPAMALLLDGRIELQQGDPAAALERFQEAFRTYPSNAGARYLAGRAAVELGEFDLALEYYQDALRADPTGTDAGFVLPQMLAAEGRLTWALDALVFRFARDAERNPRVMRMLARLGAASAYHEYAETMRATLAELDVAWAGIALADQARDISIVAGRKSAIEYLERSDRLEAPTHYEAFSAWYRMKALDGAEALAEADARLERWVAANPEVAGVQMVLGRALFAKDELEGARAAYERALELNPTLHSAHHEYGRVLAKLGRVDAALAAFDRSTELAPYEAEAAYEAAKTLVEADRYDEAAERVRALLIPHPWHGQAALLMVDIARAQGRAGDDEAYAMARRADRYHQNAGPRGHFEFARAAMARGEWDAALAAYEAAIEKGYEVLDSRYGRIRALVELGRGGEAVPELQALLQLEEFPARVEAEALLETLRAQEEG